jgi:hypothetical protein
VVLNVLFLFAVTRGLLKRLNYQAGRGGDGLNGGNTVGNSQLATNAQALVFSSGLGDIILNLLGRL